MAVWYVEKLSLLARHDKRLIEPSEPTECRSARLESFFSISAVFFLRSTYVVFIMKRDHLFFPCRTSSPVISCSWNVASVAFAILCHQAIPEIPSASLTALGVKT